MKSRELSARHQAEMHSMAKRKPGTLVVRSANGAPDDAVLATTALSPDVNGAITIAQFSKKYGDLSLMALVEELSSQAKAANDGDLRRAEAMLIVQAHTLDAIFNELAQRTMRADLLPQFETYLRLALKAQSQCRTTLETLAMVKNPQPVAFVRQANIAAGPQQVNNVASDASRARMIETEQTQLSGETHGLLPDTRASADASGANPPLEALGEINRTEVARG